MSSTFHVSRARVVDVCVAADMVDDFAAQQVSGLCADAHTGHASTPRALHVIGSTLHLRSTPPLIRFRPVCDLVQAQLAEAKRSHAASLRAELKQAHAELLADKELERQVRCVMTALRRVCAVTQSRVDFI